MHATALARELDINAIVVPRYPGVLCASGLLSATIEHEASTAFLRAGRRRPAAVEAVCAKTQRRVRGKDGEEGVDAPRGTTSYCADICYVGRPITWRCRWTWPTPGR
ncbi:MAG: hypothetical protein IPI73_09125 [Betaproteobacteria bacterium]|nr:hypothetical protein [Betaproteobacteria bacterium]